MRNNIRYWMICSSVMSNSPHAEDCKCDFSQSCCQWGQTAVGWCGYVAVMSAELSVRHWGTKRHSFRKVRRRLSRLRWGAGCFDATQHEWWHSRRHVGRTPVYALSLLISSSIYSSIILSDRAQMNRGPHTLLSTGQQENEVGAGGNTQAGLWFYTFWQ